MYAALPFAGMQDVMFRPVRMVLALIQTKARIVVVLVAAALGAALVGVILATRGEGSAGLSSMRNQGVAVPTPSSLASRADARVTAKLGERSGLTFYRFRDGNGRECYAVLPTSFGVSCELTPNGAFPSARNPLLYSYGVEIEQGKVTVLDVTGFAADGVDTVAALDSAGNVVARSSVTRNIFSFGVNGPKASQIVAYNADGDLVYSSPTRRR